jgi:hypothetical protein
MPCSEEIWKEMVVTEGSMEQQRRANKAIYTLNPRLVSNSFKKPSQLSSQHYVDRGKRTWKATASLAEVQCEEAHYFNSYRPPPKEAAAQGWFLGV